jgi:hypothetical protein
MTNHYQYRRLKKLCETLKSKCPMPVLLRKLGLGAHAKPSCPSPLRPDHNPSWGIFQRDGGWHFKDHGNDDSGDEVTLIARLKGWDEQRDFKRIVEFYCETARKTGPAEPLTVACPQPPASPPDLSGYSPGTEEQLRRLSGLRSISVEALTMASERGFLIFGRCFNHDVYGLKDSSGSLAEVRRLDGQLFPAFASMPEHKSHTLKGSTKSLPLGVLESTTAPSIALVEGLPDFLAAFDFMLREGKIDTVAPVTMLSASTSIEDGALAHFHGKHVRMFPHHDEAGIKAAHRWTEQLRAVTEEIDYWDFSQFPNINDLADLNAGFNSVPPTLIISEEVLP